MKTSKYILVSFFVFIFGAILVLYADAKTHNKDVNETYITTEKLPNFHTIVAEENSKIRVLNDTLNNISIELYNIKEPYKFGCYKISNDTLYVSKTETDISLIVRGESIKTVYGKKDSRITFLSFHNDSISINLNGGNINGSLGDKLISEVKVSSQNKSSIYLNLQKSNINSIALNVDNSKVTLHSNKIRNLNAILANNAELQSGKSDKLSVESDSTSTYSIVKYYFSESPKRIISYSK